MDDCPSSRALLAYWQSSSRSGRREAKSHPRGGGWEGVKYGSGGTASREIGKRWSSSVGGSARESHSHEGREKLALARGGGHPNMTLWFRGGREAARR